MCYWTSARGLLLDGSHAYSKLKGLAAFVGTRPLWVAQISPTALLSNSSSLFLFSCNPSMDRAMSQIYSTPCKDLISYWFLWLSNHLNNTFNRLFDLAPNCEPLVSSYLLTVFALQSTVQPVSKWERLTWTTMLSITVSYTNFVSLTLDFH